jgi:hypothetical protein
MNEIKNGCPSGVAAFLSKGFFSNSNIIIFYFFAIPSTLSFFYSCAHSVRTHSYFFSIFLFFVFLVFSLIEKGFFGFYTVLVRCYEFIFQSLRAITNLFKAFKIAIISKFKLNHISESLVYIKKRARSVARCVASSYHNTFFAGLLFLSFSLIENICFGFYNFYNFNFSRAYASLDIIYTTNSTLRYLSYLFGSNNLKLFYKSYLFGGSIWSVSLNMQ